MDSARTIVEVAAHKVWLIYSRILFDLWRGTGVRSRFLSSKGQDRWVATDVFRRGHRGYFLEVGAGNGFTGSDTLALELDYGWTGLCVEANPLLYDTMVNVVRRQAVCVNACIDDTPSTVAFALSGDTSGIIADDTDNSWSVRGQRLRRLYAGNQVVKLQTQTIADVLETHQAPDVIDYVSLDVEGAEERIVRSFPFSRHRVLALTVERPTPVIHDLLTRAGLILIRQHFNDGFYLHSTILETHHQSVAPVFTRKEF